MGSGNKPDLAGAAETLIDVEQNIEEYEFKITGATGFEGGKDLATKRIVPDIDIR